MKKTIFSLLSWCLLAVSASAQNAASKSELEAIQQSLDAGDNVLGVRIESSEEIVIDDLDQLPSEPQTGKKSGMQKTPAVANPNAIKDVISYLSKDGKKNTTRLSLAIYTRKDRDVRTLLLNCHPTVTSLFEAPTGGSPVDGDIKRIVDDYVMVVCPDYCGYGMSGYKQHPYLIHDVTALNCIDGLKAAIYYKETVLKKTNPFETYIVGYSQGGATALACAKFLESDACSAEDKAKINLKETCCGDGPYSTVATVNEYIKWGKELKNLEYPCVLPLIVAAAIDAYGDGCMRTVKIEDYFTPEFIATGIIDMINNKSMSTTDLNKAVMTAMNNHLLPVDLFSDKIINKKTGDLNTSTNEYKCLMRAMEQNDLTKGWVPQHHITFFHLKHDGVVPYANLEEVEKGIMKATPDGVVKVVTPDEAWSDIKRLRFAQFIFTGFEGMKSPEQCDHTTGGTLFYGAYLFGDMLHSDY